MKYCTTVVGFSMISSVSNTYSTLFFVTLEEWAKRRDPAQKYEPLNEAISQKLAGIPGAVGFAFSPSAIPGIGPSGGVTFVLKDRAGKDLDFLTSKTEKFMAAARQRSELAMVSTILRPSVPQIYVDVDRDKVLKQRVNLGDVYRTLQSFLGRGFVNYFNHFCRQWQIYVQAEGQIRTSIDDMGQFYVRNQKGAMVPLFILATARNISGPEFIMRYNLYRAAQINAEAAPGYSSAQAMAALEEVFHQTMPREMGFDYLGMSFQE